MKLTLSILLATVLFTTGCVVGDIQKPEEAATAAPSINTISPNGGTLAGSTSITLSGAAFSSGMTVSIGGRACTSVAVISSNFASCTTPANTAGAKDVTVTNPDGETSTLSSGFTYRAAPTVSSISPTLGSTAGGTTLTITGTGFISGATVAVGGINCTSVSVASTTSLTCVSGARTAASVSAVVTNSDLQASSAGGVFAYSNPPAPASVNVSAGALAGGTSITITGTDFTNPAGVTINGSICGSVTVTGTTQIDCTTSTSVAGTYDIVVTNSTGLTGSLSNAFTYQAAPTVSSISPSGGLPAGGTTVTITGTGFDTVNGVTANLGGANCGSITNLTTTSFDCTTSASAGTVNVNVINQDGDNQSDTLALAFTYQNGPTITTVAADNGTSAAGALAGGTNLTITGTNYLAGAVVTVNGNTCIQGTLNATTITCTTPSGSAAGVDVVVTNPDGQAVTATNSFRYQAAPTVTSVTPDGGPTAGSQTVTITGTGFDTTNGVSATIDGSACGTVAALTTTSFTCSTPAGTLGAKNVIVTNTDGDLQSGTLTNGFTYQPAPTVSAISPSAGALGGGTSVSISGTNFRTDKTTTVTVGGSSCTSVTVNSSVNLTCTLPTGTAGARNVIVTNYDGQTSGTSGNGLYTYQVAPTLSAVSPPAGALAGTYTLTLTGTGFLAGANVTVNGNNCSSVVVGSATSITCNAPSSGSTGTFDVVVTNADGQTDTLPTSFKYQVAPTITSVSPSGGPPTGGTTVSIFGTGFDTSNGVADVTFGGTSCTSINVITSGLLTCITPALAAGPYNVIVENNDGGSQTALLSNGFTYRAAPTVSSVSPVGGPLAGGGTLTITGTDFVTGATVQIGANTCTSPTVVNSTTITCTIPGSGATTTTVTVTNTDGQADSLATAYTYSEAPLITSVNPDNGDLDGGTVVTIFGNFINASATVTVGGVACASLNWLSIAAIECTTDANTAGNKDIVITNPDNQSSTGGENIFLHQGPPTVTGITPGIGSTLGGETVTITGTGFDTTNGINAVTVAGTACGTITLNSSTELTCVTGAGAAGNGDVVVTNDDQETQSGTLSSGYSYIAPPDISGASLDFTNGPATGGTYITITGGSGFLSGGTNSVTIGGVACTPVVFNSATSISCTTGTHTAGTYSLTVTNFDGQTDTDLTYTYDPPPTITTGGAGISQNDSQLAGGDTLIISGTNFVVTPTVTIGGAACTTPTWLSGTSMSCVIPGGTAGSADIVLTNPDGQSVTLSGEFEYRGVPVVSSVSPSVVDAAGGATLTINGSGFDNDGVISVSIDPSGTADACAPVTFVSSTQLTCPAPAHATGLLDVEVTNGDANAQQATGSNLVNYIAAPTIGGIAPATGPITGGTSITITGTNFVDTPAPTVTIDGTACANIVVTGTTQIDCDTPVGTSGAKNVVVTTYGTLTATDAGGFTYDPPPTVTSVDIPSGPKAGGTVITITGSDFVNAPSSITVGGIACGTIVFNSTTSVTCTTGGTGPTGSVSDIVVTNPDGQSGTGTGLYTYLEPPTLSSISPTEGPATGGTTITLTGTDFISGATVTIGGSACTPVTFNSATEMTCPSPVLAGTASFTVVVTNPDSQTDNIASAFTAEAVPTFTTITPNSGTLAGGTNVTITGTNFEAGATIYFGATGVSADSLNSTTIVATVPSSASTGAVDVRIQNSNGEEVTSSGAFTYTPSAPELDWQLGASSPNPPDPDPYAPGAATNEAHTYTLKNVGSLTSSSITISLSGTDAGAFFLPGSGSGDNCTGTTLVPGAECTVQVIFLGAIMPGSSTYDAVLNATDGSTSDTNDMQGTLP
jgi:hypothetical protein